MINLKKKKSKVLDDMVMFPTSWVAFISTDCYQFEIFKVCIADLQKLHFLTML